MVDCVGVDSMIFIYGLIVVFKWLVMMMLFDKLSLMVFVDVKVGDVVYFEFIQKGVDYEFVLVYWIGGV